MSTKVTLKQGSDETSGEWFHVYRECFDFDDEFVYLELGGVQFEAATSMDLSDKGSTRISIRIAETLARKLGLIDPLNTTEPESERGQESN